MNSLSFVRQDLRYSLRTMRQSPGFTAAALIALALGIGANSAIFSVVNGILLKPLAYRDPGSLVQIFETEPQLPTVPVNMADYLDWKKQIRSFESLAMYNYGVTNLTGTGTPERVRLVQTEGTLLPLLGVQPQLGRDFAAEENEPGRENKVILTHGFWRSHFGGDPNILGRTILLDQEPHTVVGVLPPAFKFFREVDLWVPLAFDLSRGSNRRGNHGRLVLGRLGPGVSIERANTEIKGLAAGLEKQFPRENSGVSAVGFILRERIVGQIRPALLMLLGAAGCVLLIACSNVANLLLARATGRRKEVAVRLALGAGRGRIVQQLLTESLVLALGAGGIGLLLAIWSTDLVQGLKLSRIPRLDEVALDWHVLLFTAGIAILTGILFGLAPVLQSSRAAIYDTLKQASGRITESAGQRRLRKALVAAEAAIATVLLIGSGLLLRSFARVSGIDPGFKPDHVLTLNVMLPSARYGKPGEVARFAAGVLERVRAAPGVRSAAFANKLPLLGGSNGTVIIEGKPRPQNTWDAPLVEFSRITPQFFQTLNIPLIRGRDFDERDRKESAEVVIVNEAFVRTFWPNEDPIGKRLASFSKTPVWKQVVGVARDVRQWGLENKAIPEMYMPLAQEEESTIALVARTDGDPLRFASTLTGQIREIDPDQPVFDVQSMDQVLGGQLGWRVFNTFLLMSFALLAMVLASIGIYGVISYSVAQRVPEIGIRMALGAQRGDVVGLIIGQGVSPAVMGAIAGAVVSLGTARLLGSLLYGVTSNDALTYCGVTALLIAVAVVASYLPARRAASIDPIEALRYE